MNVKTLDYLSIAKNFKGHKSGRRIAIIMMKNAKKMACYNRPNKRKRKWM